MQPLAVQACASTRSLQAACAALSTSAALSTLPVAPRSVRFGLLPEEEQASLAGSLAGPRGGAPLDSVQLRSRHWLIKDARGAVESEVGAPLMGGAA